MSNFILKMIALITMTIDHLGVFIFPGMIEFRIIGRLSFILYAFLLTEGFINTSNRYRYINRLTKMAIISQLGMLIPGVVYPGNIFFTLTIGLYGLILLEEKAIIKYVLLLVISNFLPIDYSSYGVALIGLFYVIKVYKLNYLVQIILFTLLNYYAITNLNFSTITYYSTISLVLTWFYSGKRGYNSPLMTTIFYWYYPIHFALLYLIGTFLI